MVSCKRSLGLRVSSFFSPSPLQFPSSPPCPLPPPRPQNTKARDGGSVDTSASGSGCNSCARRVRSWLGLSQGVPFSPLSPSLPLSLFLTLSLSPSLTLSHSPPLFFSPSYPQTLDTPPPHPHARQASTTNPFGAAAGIAGALEVVRLCCTILAHGPFISTFALPLPRAGKDSRHIRAKCATSGANNRKLQGCYLLHVSFSLPPIKLLPCRLPTPNPLSPLPL